LVYATDSIQAGNGLDAFNAIGGAAGGIVSVAGPQSIGQNIVTGTGGMTGMIAAGQAGDAQALINAGALASGNIVGGQTGTTI